MPVTGGPRVGGRGSAGGCASTGADNRPLCSWSRGVRISNSGGCGGELEARRTGAVAAASVVVAKRLAGGRKTGGGVGVGVGGDGWGSAGGEAEAKKSSQQGESGKGGGQR